MKNLEKLANLYLELADEHAKLALDAYDKKDIKAFDAQAEIVHKFCESKKCICKVIEYHAQNPHGMSATHAENPRTSVFGSNQ